MRNVNVNNRIVCYDILELGDSMKAIGLLIMSDNITNRVIDNRKRGVFTRAYIDEAHLLLKNPYSAEFMLKAWKRFRKYGAVQADEYKIVVNITLRRFFNEVIMSEIKTKEKYLQDKAASAVKKREGYTAKANEIQTAESGLATDNQDTFKQPHSININIDDNQVVSKANSSETVKTSSAATAKEKSHTLKQPNFKTSRAIEKRR